MNEEISISTGNEISPAGLLTAGTLLVAFTILPIITLIAYWPDKLPTKDSTTTYRNQWFHMQLMDSAFLSKAKQSSPNTVPGNTMATDSSKNDTGVTKKPVEQATGSPKAKEATSINVLPASGNTDVATIELNSILLILVVVSGFMGSMIYIASSFTNFVGSDKFKRSWVLWYILKPFIGSALAIVIYFVFRAGLLNFNDPTNINLFGIVTLSAFAGLFTDDATLKLKEIFEVIFKPKDVRTDKLDEDQIKIAGIKPEKLILTEDNQLTITGQGLKKSKLILKINDQIITNSVVKDNAISFSYKIPEEQKDLKEFKLVITDENGKQLFSKILGI